MDGISRRIFCIFFPLAGCTQNNRGGLVELQALESKWVDALRVAKATSRIALSGPIAQLQAIRRDAEAVVVSECLTDAKSSLRNHMDATINAFLAFMAKNESEAQSELQRASIAILDYERSRGSCASDSIGSKVGSGLPEVQESGEKAYSLGYVKNSSSADRAQYLSWDSGQKCENCMLFKPDNSQCVLLMGRVRKEGWCSAWAKKG